jgi:hypothetical protein
VLFCLEGLSCENRVVSASCSVSLVNPMNRLEACST